MINDTAFLLITDNTSSRKNNILKKKCHPKNIEIIDYFDAIYTSLEHTGKLV